MTLTAVLFAGGESRRMGTDKATLGVAGEPLWQRQLRTLRKLQPDALWISVRTRPSWCPPEIETVLDEPPSRGPLSGLAAVLQRMRTSHALVLAVDLPAMTGGQLQKLWDQARPGFGVVPISDEWFEPLSAVYPVEAASIAARSLDGPDDSLQSFARSLIKLNRVVAHPLAESERPYFHNLNSPSDLKDLRS